MTLQNITATTPTYSRYFNVFSLPSLTVCLAIIGGIALLYAAASLLGRVQPSSRGLLEAAKVAHEEKKFPRALMLYNQLLASPSLDERTRADVLYNQGLIFQETAEYDRALHNFKQCLSSPLNTPQIVANLHFRIGRALFGLRNYSESLAQAEQALLASPILDAEMLFLKGQSHYHLHEHTLAKRYLTQALQCNKTVELHQEIVTYLKQLE